MLAPTVMIAGGTQKGHSRNANEDAIFFDESRGLAVVSDGMGGAAGGAIASQLVVSVFSSLQNESPCLTTLISDGHKAICARACSEQDLQGMGATVVALLVTPNSFQIAWVGDSRAYLCRPGGLSRLTRDHSLAEHHVELQLISAAELHTVSFNPLLKVLGGRSPQAELVHGKWSDNDRILLCSDGLTNTVTDSQIYGIVNGCSEPQAAITQLIERALETGGSDDISVILICN